jgi:hypothetical protein
LSLLLRLIAARRRRFLPPAPPPPPPPPGETVYIADGLGNRLTDGLGNAIVAAAAAAPATVGFDDGTMFDDGFGWVDD